MDHIFDNGYTYHAIELFSRLMLKTENGRFITSLITNLKILNSFCKDLLKSSRFHLILLGKKEQKSHYKPITKDAQNRSVFYISVCYIQSMLLLDSVPNIQKQRRPNWMWNNKRFISNTNKHFTKLRVRERRVDITTRRLI